MSVLAFSTSAWERGLHPMATLIANGTRPYDYTVLGLGDSNNTEQQEYVPGPGFAGAVIVSLDVGLVCRGKAYPYPANHILYGTQFAAPAVSEVGLSVLDTLCLTGKESSPARYASLGVPLHGHIQSTRILVPEYLDHWNHDCIAEKQLSPPRQFEEGRVVEVSEMNLASSLSARFEKIYKQRVTQEGYHRKIIFLVWDRQPVESTLAGWGLNWLTRPGVEVWKMKRFSPLTGTNALTIPSCLPIMASLGLYECRQHPLRDAQIAHNASKNSVYMIRLLLAFEYMSPLDMDRWYRNGNLLPVEDGDDILESIQQLYI
ncbi:uncharacterized protein FFB20_14749 [Fusarium fujikuroi]|uniref:Uncharacterized protein n=1 Tax=Gibberella fujikuroi (strain CBS 195.34 / IMI 58289 / NRRL A-6831) TaxID=1279085 RepID=S0DPV8_GIBF5|nr:uncharacterized protein FFUJ_04305 [Fusarium fujikuroi IMI 58289]KLO91984.1 Uncharacterized protein Y057_1820 [Fusarium fujikuroi]KLP17695.1 uncharacterized protein LW94_10957 [Fusarium fujikuroi]CCT64471.1 uncharacterized protein FFUJ_04305 [Fusarium fujikuroi IMI 58289]SCN73682.1 uncharacterized protein FFE2_02911 [Fusarium fujikuroi]SCN88327.1 uncharacterized protein FFM5_04357 [Fusarium fujikuroi]